MTNVIFQQLASTRHIRQLQCSVKFSSIQFPCGAGHAASYYRCSVTCFNSSPCTRHASNRFRQEPVTPSARLPVSRPHQSVRGIERSYVTLGNPEKVSADLTGRTEEKALIAFIKLTL
ncbi:hypothetical protein PoB_000237300 [Plakobranchus ocellatus]|uniref:Uncharacterized protein n=1 Tax=Plakobranchus ocellatus TaxID=259542 RepID=A0AAV3Y082_9GAST|nr:hypothetical protein PoB_000237300 [Plakobranchus ocellatus]